MEHENYWNKRMLNNISCPLIAVGDITHGYYINKKKYERTIEEIEKLGINFNGKRVLDAGCGFGYFSSYFESKGAEVVSIDFSKFMTDICKVHLDNKIVTTSLSDFIDIQFDYIFSANVLIHITDEKEWKESVLNLRDLLKDDGKLILFQAFNDHKTKKGYFYQFNRNIENYTNNGLKIVKKTDFDTIFCKIGSYVYYIYKKTVDFLDYIDRKIKGGKMSLVVFEKVENDV